MASVFRASTGFQRFLPLPWYLQSNEDSLNPQHQTKPEINTTVTPSYPTAMVKIKVWCGVRQPSLNGSFLWQPISSPARFALPCSSIQILSVTYLSVSPLPTCLSSLDRSSCPFDCIPPSLLPSILWGRVDPSLKGWREAEERERERERERAQHELNNSLGPLRRRRENL